MDNKRIMLGNEAIARGAYEAGVSVSSAYPGTPSTEISEYISQYDDIYSEWAPNEKVAMEVAIGASISGMRAMASMKHVGVNVASDPLYTASYIGARGGLVLVVADDPGMYSSQNEQDSRMVARAAKVPLLEPSNSSEAKEYIKYAFELSEIYDTPIMVRTTTRLSHSQSLVTIQDREDRLPIEYERNIAKNVMVPAHAKLRHVVVEERMSRMQEDSYDYPINHMELNDRNIGFITSGIPYLYVKEAMPNASVLKLGIINPLPRKLIEEFASKVDKLIIFEELDPVIEEQVRSWGIEVDGKNLFTLLGEYSSSMLTKAFNPDNAIDTDAPVSVPVRPPILCPGCPHRSVYSVLSKLKIHGAGDIGCYTLGVSPPLNVVDTTVCMGASISTLHGMEKSRGRDYTKNWVALIGDSTFMHTGVNSLMNAVYNKSSITVIILDNSTTGMTGHQEHAATGKTLKGEVTNQVDIVALCRALGVERVKPVNAFDMKQLEQVVKEELATDGVSVIITKSPCVLIKGLSFPNVCKTISDSCVKCGACLRPGCPALTKREDGKIAIDENMCNGCGLCMDLCNFTAIVKEVRL